MRLLRQPRYMVGFLAAILYMLWVFAGPMSRGNAGRGGPFILLAALGARDASGAAAEGLLLLASTVLALAVLLTWILSPLQSPVTLTAAEIHMLLPAPIPRRQIIQYGLVRTQPTLLIVTGLFVLFSRPGSPALALRLGAALWMTLTLWDLHAKGRNLTRCRLRDARPARALLGRTLVGTGLALYGLALGAGLVDLGTRLWRSSAWSASHPVDPAFFLGLLGGTARGGGLSALLLPFRWVVAPLIAGGSHVPWTVWLPPLALLVVHHEWVVRSEARFEDEALARERQRAADRGRRRAGVRGIETRARTRYPFPLHPTGRPEVAILWKNLLVAPRLSGKQSLALLLLFPTVAFFLNAFLGRVHGLVTVQITLALQALLLGPFLAAVAWPRGMSHDLRRNLEMLRTWPVEGWRLLAAQVAAPTLAAAWIALAGLGWLLGLYAGLRRGGGPADLPLSEILQFAAGLGLPEPLLLPALGASVTVILAAIALLIATLHAVGTLLFPGWVLMLQPAGGGLASGHGILGGLVTLFVLVIALIPALVLSGVLLGLHLLLGWGPGPLDVPLFTLAAVLPVILVAHILLRVGGRLWTRLDPSREILEH